MGSPTNCGDIPVKKDLFKDVKYYVAGSIAPEVSVGYLLHCEFFKYFHFKFTLPLLFVYSHFCYHRFGNYWSWVERHQRP